MTGETDTRPLPPLYPYQNFVPEDLLLALAVEDEDDMEVRLVTLKRLCVWACCLLIPFIIVCAPLPIPESLQFRVLRRILFLLLAIPPLSYSIFISDRRHSLLFFTLSSPSSGSGQQALVPPP